jgi:hypothetical protein
MEIAAMQRKQLSVRQVIAGGLAVFVLQSVAAFALYPVNSDAVLVLALAAFLAYAYLLLHSPL